jgi:protein-disulfide isomerase
MCAVLMGTGAMHAQQTTTPAAPAITPKAPPLRLQSLAPDAIPDPFPPVNPKYFTADTPTAATVDSYLHALLGWDSNRIWRVVGIQSTVATGVSKVTALVAEKTPGAKVQEAVFYVLPDGKHLIADAAGPQPFGADPYAANRVLAQQEANGPWHGAPSKELLLVEFADLQCPHCKDAQPAMKRLAEDFPQAHIVFENYPLVDIHPFAEKAALYGVCIAKKSNNAFFTYLQAVFDTQGALTAETGEQTLKDAVTKAGDDPAAIAACAATPEAKHSVAGSIKLGNSLGVDQTPMLLVNGRLIALGGIPYETLRQIVAFQAGLSGVPVRALLPDSK